MGRGSRPMPATDSYVRDLKKVHVVFALSCVAMFVTTIWMMAADHSEEWTDHQRTWERIQEVSLKSAEAQITSNAEYEKSKNDLTARSEAAKKDLDSKADQRRKLEADFKAAEMAFDLAGRQVRNQRAFRDKARADYDLVVSTNKSASLLAAGLAIFDAEQKKVDALELELQKKETALNSAKQDLEKLTKNRDEIDADLKKLNTDLARLEAAYQKLDPSNPFSNAKRKIMEWPIINGFNSHLKIIQDWIPNGRIKLGMAVTARFDRCRTCHLAIDRVEAGNVPAFPFGHPTTDSVADWVKEKQFPHPYSTHPRPELYLTASSPHQLGKFGCTLCHDGQGSGTSFANASHTPNDPHLDEEWKKQYGYHSNHFWEYPMLPKRFQESSCIKCHHNVVELGAHPTYGATAPTVERGYSLIKKYGCFGCHEIHSYDAGKAIGPDLRLEPPPEAEPPRLAADPVQKAGQERKVGPALRHLESKTTPEWTAYWTEQPSRFRPTTRMPQFFNLTNLDDKHAERLQPVELAGIAQYLFDKSQPLDLLRPDDAYEPDAERGKELLARRGCMACHSHEAFPDITADFAPNLTKTYAKIKPGADGFRWLYTWIRDPQRHHPRTRMPNLFLEPYVEGKEPVDPAADIASFLLNYRSKPTSKTANPNALPVYPEIKVDDSALDELVKLHLSKTLKNDDVEKKVLADRRYPLPKAQIKGDKIELVAADAGRPDNDQWRQMKLNYVGRRTISRYGCYGCHDIPRFEQGRAIGTALQD